MPRKRKDRVLITHNLIDGEDQEIVSKAIFDGDKGPYTKWTKEQEDFTLESLYDEIVGGRLIPTGSMPKGVVIKELLLRFKTRFGVDLTMKQLNTKIRLFKSKYVTLSKLKNSDSGLGWDAERNCFLATPEIINTHLQSNPRAHCLFGRNLWNFEHLDTVFGGSSVIGEFSSGINISAEDETLPDSSINGNQYAQPTEEVYRPYTLNMKGDAFKSQVPFYGQQVEGKHDGLHSQDPSKYIGQPLVRSDNSTTSSSVLSSRTVNPWQVGGKGRKASQSASSASYDPQSIIDPSIISRLERLVGLDNTAWMTAVDSLEGLTELERVKAYSILQKTDLGFRTVFASCSQERQLLYVKMHL